MVIAVGAFATQVSGVSAHGGERAITPHLITKWHGLAILFAGVIVVTGAALAKRTDRLSPTRALGVVFFGIVLAGVGGVQIKMNSEAMCFLSVPCPKTHASAVVSTRLT
jgi:drug/metabolite transporter (DMT)-like permease